MDICIWWAVLDLWWACSSWATPCVSDRRYRTCGKHAPHGLCLVCLIGSTGTEEILFYRLIARITYGLTSPRWNESITLSATNHCVCRVFILRQSYRLLICLWGSESMGVLMSFKAEHTDSFPGRRKARRWPVSHQRIEPWKAKSTFCFTFRLNVQSPRSFLVITTRRDFEQHVERGDYISLAYAWSCFWLLRYGGF